MLAFVVFALSFATVLEIMAGSLRGIRRARDDTEVALMAQSIMAQVGTAIPLEDGVTKGTRMDRYQWQLDIFPLAENDDDKRTLELADMSGVQLYKVELDVGWMAGERQRTLHFSTIRSALVNFQTRKRR